MKTLTLLRHAKSGYDDPLLRDFDRPLNDRGRRASVSIGQWLRAAQRKQEMPEFDHVAASPAVRCRQTIEGVEEGLGVPLAPIYEKRIYLSSSATLVELVAGFAAHHQHALLVGHNPGLEDLLLELVPRGSGPARDDAELKYPTATLARLDLDIERWAQVDGGRAQLTQFIRPRDLDPSLGPDD
ncbi:phosphohistidine phosphatase [Polymorphobacter multimanifer]|uniref:Phosphohistidine phosphatase n=1 Tax=Polymorphobacter multimanifer TaxID=1070431 RepID=A0A841L6E2_9SPHN|nr:phosphohistidine phosphatase [Polymorphobacter multimanifer]GGI70374.1 phosphohistidine phosphatase [Polymorphobacter multimanifer]